MLDRVYMCTQHGFSNLPVALILNLNLKKIFLRSLTYACPSSTSITKTRRRGRRATTIRCIKLQPLSGSRELHASVNVSGVNA